MTVHGVIREKLFLFFFFFFLSIHERLALGWKVEEPERRGELGTGGALQNPLAVTGAVGSGLARVPECVFAPKRTVHR